MPLPPEVADDEVAVRAIKTPYHLNSSGTRITRRALHPPVGMREISVMRLLIGDHACKDRAVEWVNPAGTYCGLAVAGVARIRNVGPEVVDAPEDTYEGHAHIVLELPRPDAEEPLESSVSERYNSVLDALLALFHFERDPSPENAGWSGPALATLG